MTYELLTIIPTPPPPVAKVSLTADEVGKIKVLLGHCVGHRTGTTDLFHQFVELARKVNAPDLIIYGVPAIREFKDFK